MNGITFFSASSNGYAAATERQVVGLARKAAGQRDRDRSRLEVDRARAHVAAFDPVAGGGGDDIDGRGRNRVDEVRGPDRPARHVVPDRAGHGGGQHVDGVAVRVGRDLGRRADAGVRRRRRAASACGAFSAAEPPLRLPLPSSLPLPLTPTPIPAPPAPAPRSRRHRQRRHPRQLRFDRLGAPRRPQAPAGARHGATTIAIVARPSRKRMYFCRRWGADVSCIHSHLRRRRPCAHGALVDGVDVGFTRTGGLLQQHRRMRQATALERGNVRAGRARKRQQRKQPNRRRRLHLHGVYVSLRAVKPAVSAGISVCADRLFEKSTH